MTKVLGGQMVRQTISLFRYLLLGVVNRRLAILVFVLLMVSSLLGGFVSELAIIDSQEISAALQGDFLRYSLVFVALLLVTSNVAEDYQSKQFERLLTMPISRWQYIVAQLLVILTLATVLSLPVAGTLYVSTTIDLALYWAASLWLELVLVGLIGFLGILSLEKVPQAVIFATAIYLLVKFSGVINQMLSESLRLSEGSASNRFAERIFEGVLYVMPGAEAFAQNNAFFDPSLISVDLLLSQLLTVVIYSAFLIAVCLVDFYRKEFNL
jgi:ABC-type transport system involved in multi-copper enzyme maturation permease subunit